jgi:hypothetical protein
MVISKMASEREILQAAIAATEKEIFDEGLDLGESTLDGTGDKTIEAMGDGLEGQHEPEEDEDEQEGELEAAEGNTEAQPEVEAAAEDEAEPKGESEVQPAPKPADGRVPPGVLRDANARARAAEAERDALKAQLGTVDQRLEALVNQRLEAALARLQPQQQPAQVAPKPQEVVPDLLEDPVGYARYLEGKTQERLEASSRQFGERLFNQSMSFAQSRHGQTFVNAFEALKTQAQQNPQIARAIRDAPDPGEALIQWHKRTEAMREIGDDPAQFRTRVAEEARTTLMKDPEFRRQVLEELRGEAQTGDNGRPRTTTNLPRSLARAAGGNARAVSDHAFLDGSDNAVFSAAFNT